MDDNTKSTWKSIVEEIEVSGQHLLSEINRLIAEGNVRKLVVKSEDGHVFLTVPLTAGALVGGIVTLGAPWLAILAAVAGVATKIKLEVVRDVPDDDDVAPTAEAPKPTESEPGKPGDYQV